MGVSKKVQMGKVEVAVCVVTISAWWLAFSTAAPASPADCNSQLPQLLPCAGFVQGTDKSPSSECCKGLSSVVSANPTCLCTLLNSGSAGGASINTTLASQLPSRCNIKNVSPSQCKEIPGSSGPAPAPVAGGTVPGSSPGGPSRASPPNTAFMTTSFASACLGLIAFYVPF